MSNGTLHTQQELKTRSFMAFLFFKRGILKHAPNKVDNFQKQMQEGWWKMEICCKPLLCRILSLCLPLLDFWKVEASLSYCYCFLEVFVIYFCAH